MTMVHDLLVEPLLSWRDHQRTRGMTTLPGILARLGAGELGDYPRLRAHQFHPWSMFLTQLAAIALKRAGRTNPRCSEDEWRAMLLALTGDRHEAWCLVVDDLSQPAFFQPPVPEAATAHNALDKWKTCVHPDEVDVLVTSKAHDVKTALLDPAVPEFWVYALVTLQTMQGYPGRGYTRVARMKGGYGSRPRVGLSPDLTPSGRFRREVEVLLETWSVLLTRGFADAGVALVWTEPWNGSDSLDHGDLAPHFIEICWRLRCLARGSVLQCAYTTTAKRRCLPNTDDGDVGDPWIPIQRDKGALTVGSRGFGYELVSHLLLGDDYEPAASQRPRASDGDPVLFIASSLARGQGKTQGLHERTLHLAGEVRRRLGEPVQRKALGQRAMSQVEQAKTMRSKVLFPALKALALGDRVVPDALDARVDERFFLELFGSLHLDDDEARVAWAEQLVALARDELRRAVDRAPFADARRYQAIAAAESIFAAGLRKHFADVLPDSTQQGSQLQEGGQA